MADGPLNRMSRKVLGLNTSEAAARLCAPSSSMMHADCSPVDVEEYPFAICTAALVALIDDTVATTRAGMRAFHTLTHEAKVGDFGDASAAAGKTVQTTTKKTIKT
jgi:hypothetical protein